MKWHSVRAFAALCLVAILPAGCGGGNPHADLDTFMAETKAKPSGRIEPIPPMKAYKPFTYSASGLRSPFVQPVEVREIAHLQGNKVVKPDPNRPKEFLEQFSLDSLAMVGSLEIEGTRWALIRDTEGSVHRVRVGNYIGRNNGRIVESAENHVVVMEVVSTGEDAWVERPRTLELKTTDKL